MPDEGVKTVEINGVNLAYREIGSGYPLILINGFASPMDTWNPPILETLARQFRVIIFDNRGCGYSSASAEPFSIPLFAGDTAVLMDAMGITRAHVLGLSMGASIAQELVLAHPERVDRLVLIAGTCGGTEGIRMEPEVWDRLSDKSGELLELANRMFSVLFPKSWLASHDPWKSCPAVHETTTVENAARQAEAFFHWQGSYDRLPELQSPVLVITGEEDVVIPPENANILARRIPGAIVVRFPGAGHGLQYQYPVDIARSILEFLADRA
jgi:pimeloyl-ACP methyl ester carboxylesterase